MGFQAEGNASFTGPAYISLLPALLYPLWFCSRPTAGRRNPVPESGHTSKEWSKPQRNPWTQQCTKTKSRASVVTTLKHRFLVSAQQHLTSSISPSYSPCFGCSMTGNFQPEYFYFLGQVSFWGSWLLPQKEREEKKRKKKRERDREKAFVAFYIPQWPESEQHPPASQSLSQRCDVALVPFLEILGQHSSLRRLLCPEGLERSPFFCIVTDHFALDFPGLWCNPKAEHYFKNKKCIFLAFIYRRTEKSPI